MRLAVISDVHGNLVALDAVLADLRRHAPDAIVNLGDCVTSPLWPRETFERLSALALPTVRGNHDRWITATPREAMTRSIAYTHDQLTPEQRAALAALPRTLDIAPDVFAVHGTPDSDTEYLLEEPIHGRLALATAAVLRDRLGATPAGLVLCGHSHHQHVAVAPGQRLVLNPGSVGCPRYADNDDPFIAEAGSPHARYAIATRRGGKWSADLVVLEYDWTPVVQRARDNGRSDWAEGFAGVR